MIPIASLPEDDAAHIEIVLSDIDDTLTEDGRLLPDAYAAIWRLAELGIRFIPVTGRPAGWCDCIVRQWPVDAVIGENGAFACYLEDRRLHELVHPSVSSREIREGLIKVKEAVLEEIPGARVARDQPYRRYDLAIDFREDEPELSFADAERIAEICRRSGAQAKISSIHVNTWYGDYDKLGMAKTFLGARYGYTESMMKKLCAYCGDSPNDEPMFAFFPISCAVENIKNTLSLIKALPRYVTSRSHGRGFAEFIDELIRKRK